MTTTAKARIGQVGTITAATSNDPASALVFEVRIVDVSDARKSYGKTRYLVTPVAGSGQAWREAVSFPL